MIRKRLVLANRPKPTNWNRESYTHAEVKRDGIRLSIFRLKGDITAYGRKSYINHWLRLRLNLKINKLVSALPIDTVLDGELFVSDSSQSSDVLTALIKDPNSVRFEVFAVPYFNGKNRTMASCLDMRELIKETRIPSVPIVATNSRMNKKDLLQYIKEKNIEGVVLKQYGYMCWWKLKPEYTLDAIVIGLNAGEGRHTGKVGSLEVAVLDSKQYQIPIAAVSGMTDKVRYAITDKDIGRVVEVQYDEMAKDRLRFPRFVRWRDDKPVSECTLAQIEENRL
jgi:ATP-dependent DNA ligase